MVGDIIKQLREDKEISQKQLAEILNISPSTVGMYEQNRRVPSPEILNLIADYFEVSTDFLLGRTFVLDNVKISDKALEVLNIIKRAGINIDNIDNEKLWQLLKLSNIEK